MLREKSYINRQAVRSWSWRYTLLILGPGRQKQEISEIEVRLAYKASSRTTRAVTQRTLSQNNNNIQVSKRYWIEP